MKKGDKELKRIKIALLDSGILCAMTNFQGEDLNPIKGHEHYVGPDIKKPDTCGHGTHLACLLLQYAPDADLYIAKVTSDLRFNDMNPVAKAIQWAVEDVKADIITMSFGSDVPSNAILTAIEESQKTRPDRKHKPILFASAANHGLNKKTPSFPASDSRVICTFILDGAGADNSGMNPPTSANYGNFGTLGVDIETRWDNKAGETVTRYTSGTSYATPVLAAIAANYLAWLDYYANDLGDALHAVARAKEGIEAMFADHMGCKKSSSTDISFVAPWHFFEFGGYDVSERIPLRDEVMASDKGTDISCIEAIRKRLKSRIPGP
ncbi:hypothetical protein ACJZ2D_001066 [Fusarium nematophilum]